MPEKIIIEINDPLIKSEKKYSAAVDALAKAMRITSVRNSTHEHPEPTPYRALEELSQIVARKVTAGLNLIYRNIVTSWLRTGARKSLNDGDLSKAIDSEPFKLNGQTYINPRTGAPMTVAEYKAITEDLTKVFGYLFGETEEMLVKRAMALGHILQTMDPAQAVNTTYSDAMDIYTHVGPSESEQYAAQEQFASQHTAELIQDISSSARRRIMSTILESQKTQDSAAELEHKLFENFSEMNRDWRRIAQTESANNFNNGYLVGIREKTPVNTPIFMQGVSAATACPWCQERVNRRVVVLLDAAPSSGESVVVDGRTYPAIWPGKDNFGRKRSEWWVAAGTQHPHCRCSWIQYFPGHEDVYAMYEEAMERNAARSQE